ncbi:hypothetical protein [Clostridium sp.]|uniref:hypothetical protein n=1 Tax=Clostridium sp. TaxID=1506 RepID=UPI0035A04BE3
MREGIPSRHFLIETIIEFVDIKSILMPSTFSIRILKNSLKLSIKNMSNVPHREVIKGIPWIKIILVIKIIAMNV